MIQQCQTLLYIYGNLKHTTERSLRPPYIPELCFRDSTETSVVCRLIDKLRLTVVGWMSLIIAIADAFDVEDGLLSMGATGVLPNASDGKWGKIFELSDSENVEHTAKRS